MVGSTVLDYNLVKGFLRNALYGMTSWPGITLIMDLILRNNTEQLAAALTEQSGSTILGNPVGWLMPFTALEGIQCGHRTARASTFEKFLPAGDEMYNISRIYGDATIYECSVSCICPSLMLTYLKASMSACAQWPYSAKERYEGDFHVKTKYPVLILGNIGDAFTPLASAYNLSSGFEGTVVLELNSYGHASTSVPSSCSWKHIAAFWQDSSLPPIGTQCSAEAQPFKNVTWADVFAAGSSFVGVSK